MKRIFKNSTISVSTVLVTLTLGQFDSPCFSQLTLPEKAVKGIARTNLDSPKVTRAQLDRRERNNAAIKAMGLHVLEKLPVTENELTIKPRSTDEITKRCIAVEICAIKAESKDQELTNKIIERFQAASFFTPKEKAYIKNTSPSDRDRANFNWQYERVHVLLWALGYVNKLNPVNKYCNVAEEAKIIKGKTVSQLVAGAKARSMKEIMDQADLYYRMHWVAVDLRLHGKHSELLDEETIQERHHALNWLIRYLNDDWDDVTTDT